MDRKAGYLHRDKMFLNVHRFPLPHGTEYTECQAFGGGGAAFGATKGHALKHSMCTIIPPRHMATGY
jgi:hypothetical protein